MEPKPDGFVDTVQWAITTGLGLLGGVFIFVMRGIYRELDKLKAQQDENAREAGSDTIKGDSELWQAVKELQRALDEDRKDASLDRQKIASMMATKDEMKKQLDLLFDRLVRRLDKE
jgi:hypothetical protein